MIPLARWAAIPGEHTRLTHLQTNYTPLLVALSAGVCRLSIHDDYPTIISTPITLLLRSALKGPTVFFTV